MDIHCLGGKKRLITSPSLHLLANSSGLSQELRLSGVLQNGRTLLGKRPTEVF